MALTKIGAWTNPISSEADRPSRSATDMKAIFDSNTNQIKTAFNTLVDDVEAGDADMTFTEATTRANILSGESMATILGKVKKFMTDGETAVSTVSVNAAYPDRYLSQDGTYTTPSVGEAANGLVQGGTTGQYYRKKSATDYDGEWTTVTPATIGAAAASTSVTATLAYGTWTGTEAPYSYTLSVSGVTATSPVEILPGASITAAQLEALQGANIQDGGQSAGVIYLSAYGDKPEIDLPIRIIVRGDL